MKVERMTRSGEIRRHLLIRDKVSSSFPGPRIAFGQPSLTMPIFGAVGTMRDMGANEPKHEPGERSTLARSYYRRKNQPANSAGQADQRKAQGRPGSSDRRYAAKGDMHGEKSDCDGGGASKRIGDWR